MPPSPERPVIVIAGGDAIDPRLRGRARRRDVIAADSGRTTRLALGLRVDELIGDLDSVQSRSIDASPSAGGAVDRHPSAKDFTDLELALQRRSPSARRGSSCSAATASRDDHHLANRLLLGAPFLAATEVVAWSGAGSDHRGAPDRTVPWPRGLALSLLAVDGPAGRCGPRACATRCDDEILEPGSTRGVSNELVAAEAEVTTGRGVLLAVQPDAIDHLASMTERLSMIAEIQCLPVAGRHASRRYAPRRCGHRGDPGVRAALRGRPARARRSKGPPDDVWAPCCAPPTRRASPAGADSVVTVIKLAEGGVRRARHRGPADRRPRSRTPHR